MLIIVSGLPGSGKSYFSSRLARKLGAEYVGSDQTRGTIDARGRYSFADKLEVYEEMAHIAAEALRKGKTVVVDATFYRHEMQHLFTTMAKLLHTRICYVQVVADEAIIKERLSKSRRDSEADYSVYRRLKPQYESPDVSHLVLESTNENIDDMIAKAEEYLRQINDGSAAPPSFNNALLCRLYPPFE